jgi:hypothetical protein
MADPRPRAARLVQTVLRCYPPRWRRRHGDEAAELATLLIRDGTPVAPIAWSYLAGAVRAWLTPRPRLRLRTVACALLAAACSLGLAAGLLASTVPARAASGGQPRPQAHCRPGPVPPALGKIPAVGRPRLVTRPTGHGRPC